ncbi:MAG: hypothetical protein J5687_05755 [Treponema sp.]|nr:hypothetical protein [Treponema sp.]
MKKNIFKTLAITFTFASLVLTGCVQNFDGTKVNYSQKKEELTGNYGNTSSAQGLGSWNIQLSSSSIPKAAEDTEITVTFSSCAFELDKDSVEKAVTFYKLKNNSKNNYFAPEYDGDLTKTLIHVTEPHSYTGSVSFLYRVDTSSVQTSEIALVIDATKLKYKNGSAVLSNDGNLKAGETTDTVVEYISVGLKADGSTPSKIGDTYGNHYSESYTWSSGAWLSYVADLVDSESKPTGAKRYKVSAPDKRAAFDDDPLYDDSLAETLSKMFKLQIQEPGTSKWKDGAKLEFTYHAANSTTATDPYSKNTYTTDTPVFEPGTKWRIIQDSSVAYGTAPAWKADAYGHPEFKDNRKALSTVKLNDYYDYPEVFEEFVPYGDKDTPYIFAWPTTWTFTSAATSCTASAAQTAQRSMFTVTNPSSGKILIKPAANVVLEGTDGFIVVDSNNAIIETEKTVHTDSSDVVDYILLTIKDKFFNGTVKVYVNEKTTLKTNTYNEKQKQFGCYPDQSQSELSGYVLISTTEFNISNSVSYAGVPQLPITSSSDSDDYTFAWVDGRVNSYKDADFKYYLKKNKQYRIRVLGVDQDYYNILYNYANNWDDRMRYGCCKIIDSKTKEVVATKYGFNGYDYYQSFTVSKDGWYIIKCCPYFTTSSNYDSSYYGWMAFHLYEN